MRKILLCVALSFNLLFSYFSAEDSYSKQVNVLRSLDIDISFLQDSMFLNMKEDIKDYQSKQFLKILDDGSEFVPVLKNMLKEANVPDAFLYLAMAESGFSTKAYSKAKASGLWQFMAPTAKKFGLEIDEYIDERRDLIKSTEAAISYLQELHNTFGKWYLAAMAYNCGEGRVSRAIKEAGSDDLYTLLDEKKKYIPAETRRYIRKIVMMAHLSENTNFVVGNDASHLLNSGNSAVVFEKIELKGGTSLGLVANAIDMSLNQLLSYNAHLNYFFTPPTKEKYHIYIPYEKISLLTQNIGSIESKSKFLVHTVAKGDSFYKIASKYNVKQKMIKDFNNINSDTLKIGQKLVIPSMAKDAKFYVIKNGDTLTSISSKYKTSVQSIVLANDLQGSTIYPGDKLAIPMSF
ncbi:MAG: LysM peptidoglycan-binding domain-containing protein [Campylobacteraceae bacterium]